MKRSKVCACGCGQSFTSEGRADRRIYASATCRSRASVRVYRSKHGRSSASSHFVRFDTNDARFTRIEQLVDLERGPEARGLLRELRDDHAQAKGLDHPGVYRPQWRDEAPYVRTPHRVARFR